MALTAKDFAATQPGVNTLMQQSFKAAHDPAIERLKAALTRPHQEKMEGVAQQQANTQEQYRKDQARWMDEQRRVEKLKLLLGGNGVGGEKIGAEQQKVINLADTARTSLNNTEALASENPKTAAAQTALQSIPLIGDPLSNAFAGLFGGKFKEVRDSKASTKEALQNLYTGAAASGEQVPAFQGFSGPGAVDILKGNVDTSNNTRDAINSFQQRQAKSANPLNPEVLGAAGMQNDPIAKQVMAQQTAAEQARKQQMLSKLTPEDRALYTEIQQNPSHPNAAKAAQKLRRRYGNVF